MKARDPHQASGAGEGGVNRALPTLVQFLPPQRGTGVKLGRLGGSSLPPHQKTQSPLRSTEDFSSVIILNPFQGFYANFYLSYSNYF